MEHDAGIDPGDQELIWPKLRNQSGSVGVLGTRCAAAVVLRKAEGNGCLP